MHAKRILYIIILVVDVNGFNLALRTKKFKNKNVFYLLKKHLNKMRITFVFTLYYDSVCLIDYVSLLMVVISWLYVWLCTTYLN